MLNVFLSGRTAPQAAVQRNGGRRGRPARPTTNRRPHPSRTPAGPDRTERPPLLNATSVTYESLVGKPEAGRKPGPGPGTPRLRELVRAINERRASEFHVHRLPINVDGRCMGTMSWAELLRTLVRVRPEIFRSSSGYKSGYKALSRAMSGVTRGLSRYKF